MYQPWSSVDTPPIVDTTCKGTFRWRFASHCNLRTVLLAKIVRQTGHGAIKGQQNCMSGTLGHTVCPKALNNEDQRLIHTAALPKKANNAVGWVNQRLAMHSG